MTICPGTVLLVFMVSLHLHSDQKQQSSTSYNYHWEHRDHADLYHHWSIDQSQSIIMIIIVPIWSLIIVVKDDHLHFLPQVSLWIIASWTLRQCERYQLSSPYDKFIFRTSCASIYINVKIVFPMGFSQVPQPTFWKMDVRWRTRLHYTFTWNH